MQREGRREWDAERGSVRMKRRKEREERVDEAEKITTKRKTNPTPILEEVLSRLDSQNCGRITCLQGKTALL
jgi:hypothetical protein